MYSCKKEAEEESSRHGSLSPEVQISSPPLKISRHQVSPLSSSLKCTSYLELSSRTSKFGEYLTHLWRNQHADKIKRRSLLTTTEATAQKPLAYIGSPPSTTRTSLDSHHGAALTQNGSANHSNRRCRLDVHAISS